MVVQIPTLQEEREGQGETDRGGTERRTERGRDRQRRGETETDRQADRETQGGREGGMNRQTDI